MDERSSSHTAETPRPKLLAMPFSALLVGSGTKFTVHLPSELHEQRSDSRGTSGR